MCRAPNLLSAVCLTCRLLFGASGLEPDLSLDARMVTQLLDHEGLRLAPYRDSRGNITIGVGWNVSSRGWRALQTALGRPVAGLRTRLEPEEALSLLARDIAATEASVARGWPVYWRLGIVRRRAVLDIAFTTGAWPRFYRTRRLLAAGQFDRAAWSLQQTRWYRQVGLRGKTIVRMIRTGRDE